MPATATRTLGLPAAANHPLHGDGLKTGPRRCSGRGPAAPFMRGPKTGLGSVGPTTEEKAQKMPSAAEMTPARPGTTSATAMTAGPQQREGYSWLWKPRPGAALPPPAAAAMTTPAKPTGHRVREAVARGPAGGLDDRQDQLRHPWMPGSKPKCPWDRGPYLVRNNCLNKQLFLNFLHALRRRFCTLRAAESFFARFAL